MKPITTNTLLKPSVRAWVYNCGQWHLAMKSSVEHRYLRNVPHQFLDDLHSFQFGAVVQRGNGGNSSNSSLDFRRNQNGHFVVGAAVNNSMSYDVNFIESRKNSFRAAAQGF